MESAKGGRYLARVEVKNVMLWQEVATRVGVVTRQHGGGEC